MEEPEQKRVKRITEYIEDEIVRTQHLPLEELIRHKAAMIHVLQFLNIEEAYAVSLASRRVYMWFQQNDIWYALAQRWLSPARLTQCEAWVEQVKPKGKRINYLWLLLGEHAQRHFEIGHWHIVKIRIGWFSINLTTTTHGRWYYEGYGEAITIMDRLLREPSFSITTYAPEYHSDMTTLNPAQVVYYLMSRYSEATVVLKHSDSDALRIRSKLPTY